MKHTKNGGYYKFGLLALVILLLLLAGAYEYGQYTITANQSLAGVINFGILKNNYTNSTSMCTAPERNSSYTPVSVCTAAFSLSANNTYLPSKVVVAYNLFTNSSSAMMFLNSFYSYLNSTPWPSGIHPIFQNSTDSSTVYATLIYPNATPQNSTFFTFTIYTLLGKGVLSVSVINNTASNNTKLKLYATEILNDTKGYLR